MHQRIHQQPAGQAFQGKGVHPAEMAGYQAEECGREQQVKQNAGGFCGRGTGGARERSHAHPSAAEQEGEKEGGDTLSKTNRRSRAETTYCLRHRDWQLGAGIASLIGRSLPRSTEKLRLIAPVGAAVGLAAAFNAPISAVLFVVEEVIGTWSAGALGAIVLAAASSVVTMWAFLGPESLFHVPPFRVAGPAEMLCICRSGCCRRRRVAVASEIDRLCAT